MASNEPATEPATEPAVKPIPTFADLPWELRRMIWNYAIDNNQGFPQVHFFSASDTVLECLASTPKGADHKKWHWWPMTTKLRSPCWDASRPKQLNWDLPGNHSGYLDSALFNTCNEVRRFMHERWIKHNIPKNYRPGEENKFYFLASNVKFTDENKNEFFITMHVEDIVFLNAADTLRLDHIWHLAMESFIDNFGIEYDPAWYDEYTWYNENGDSWEDTPERAAYEQLIERSDTVLERVLAYLRQMGPDRQVYLLEPRLKPTEAFLKQAAVRETQVFKGNGRRYFEIKEEDVRRGFWQTEDGKDSEELDRSVFSFESFLWDHLIEHATVDNGLDSFEYLGEMKASDFVPMVWVLGCVMDE